MVADPLGSNQGHLQMKRRTWSMLLLLLLLTAIVYLALAGAEVGMLLNNNASHCDLKFPKWFGCVLANHENLAGGLIGAFGTILAGLGAWVAVQNQIAADREIANRSDTEASAVVREEIKDLCELLNEFWRAADFVLLPNLTDDIRQERCRFFGMTVEAYQNVSLDSLDAALAALSIARQRAFANVIQHLRALDRHILAITNIDQQTQVDLSQIRLIWIHLSSFETALSKYDLTLARIFKGRRKASIESRTAAALIRPFVDEHVDAPSRRD
jgi:hypothetical protein